MTDRLRTFTVERRDSQLVATAIHAGHDLRPEVASITAVDEAVRRREEDPFTDRLTVLGGSRVGAHRSRFEVDLNRPREAAVYREPDDAWGLNLWRQPLPPDVVRRSLEIHDRFYAALADLLDPLVARGPVVVLDIHSYNHRRGGDARPAPDLRNPEVNVGTGSLDRVRWGPLADRFVDELAKAGVNGRALDVRENVRFKGGHLSRWVHQRYPGRACALALEFKKTFMDEWTGSVDDDHLERLRRALKSTVPGLLDAAAEAGRWAA